MAIAMLRQRKKKLARSLGLISLAAAILGSTILPPVTEISARGTFADTLDLSNPQADSKVELNASDFLALLLGDGETLSSAEADYLATLADTPLQYTNSISPRCIAVDHNEEANTLTVTVTPYTYTTADGTTLTWNPADSATVGQYTLALEVCDEDGTRSGTLENYSSVTDLRLIVPYTCTTTVPAALADRYLNLTYEYADELFLESSDYESCLAAYNAYQDYLQALASYDTAYENWQTYLVKKDKYDKDMVEYTAYKQAMSEYRTALAAFEAYESAKKRYEQAKITYAAAKEAYNEKLAAYNEALAPYEKNKAEIDHVKSVLTVLDSAFISAGGNHMYATLMGDTVATVVNKKDELVSIGKCDPNDIDIADKTSAALRVLLTEYKALKGVPARFAYYTEHYEEIKENFQTLYGRLYSLYKNTNVRSELVTRGKLERYMQFVSQLYVISTGLDDDVNRKEDWQIVSHYDDAWFEYVYYTYQELLPDESLRPADKNNADPTGVSCPEEELSAPKPPDPFTLTEPVEPEVVSRPVEPETVKKPTEPTFVKEPTIPTPVSDPGDPPIAPSYTALQQRLIDARKNGSLSKRKTGQDKTVTLHTTLQKGLQPGLVEFYDYDGQTILYSVVPNPGEAIVYEGPTPTRADTAKYAYSFTGWKDEDGQLVEDFGMASAASRCFYASYSENLRSYTITWSIEGEKQTVTLPYGSTPIFDGTPEKEETTQYTYHFVGWRVSGSKDHTTHLDDVMSDVVYEAVFEATLRRYTITWVYYEGKSTSALWDYGSTPVPPTETPTRPFDGYYIYDFIGWDATPTTVTGDVTYTAQYDALLIVQPPADDSTETAPSDDSISTETLPPDSASTETQAPDSVSTETQAPDSVSTETQAPDSASTETQAPERASTETQAPDGASTETQAPDSTSTETLSPETTETTEETQPPAAPTNVYTVTLPEGTLKVDRLFALALETDHTVSLLSADGSVRLNLNEAALSNFLEAGGTHVSLDKTDAGYALKLANTNGQPISLTAAITLQFTNASTYTKAYAKIADSLEDQAFTYENGILTLRMREDAELVFRNEYPVTVSPSENGELSADKDIALNGDVITLLLSPAMGYKIDSVQVVGTLSGQTYSVDEAMTFLMPDEPVTVSATLSRQTYTITFIVENQVISSTTYFSGDTLVPPADPTKEPDGDTVYTFTGWSPVVVPTVTADATYTAQFRGSLQSGNDTYIPPESRDRAYLLYIDIALILATLITTPIVIVRIVKRRRKKKHANKSDET